MVDKLHKGICPDCNQYWPSEAAMKRQEEDISSESESEED